MKKSIVLALQSGYWLCYLFFIFLLYVASAFGSDNAPDLERILKIVTSLLIIPGIFSFYVSYLLLFPRYLQRKNIWGLVGSLTGTATAAALIGAVTASALLGGKALLNDGLNSFAQLSIVMAGVALLNSMVALIIRGFISWFSDLKLREQLTKKTHETELQLVKAQLDPHFLFNTINNIDVLIERDAATASAYLNRLSDILRFMLFEAKTDFIPLDKEMEYVKKYIALQKIRTENKEYVSLEIEGSPEKWQIAPMTMIPFVENAFKHAVNKKQGKAISITINASHDQLTFACENAFNPGSKAQNKGGLGNDLIHQRLELLYPQSHKLTTSSNSGRYSVQLVIYKHDV